MSIFNGNCFTYPKDLEEIENLLDPISDDLGNAQDRITEIMDSYQPDYKYHDEIIRKISRSYFLIYQIINEYLLTEEKSFN